MDRCPRIVLCLMGLVALGTSTSGTAPSQGTQAISIRGHQQTLHLYGPPTGDPVVVSSGDGGWIRLGPQVAELLGARGYFVVGFDVKAYLSSLTSGRTSLRAEDEPGDYRVLADFAARPMGKKPILIGVSEGAGLRARRHGSIHQNGGGRRDRAGGWAT